MKHAKIVRLNTAASKIGVVGARLEFVRTEAFQTDAGMTGRRIRYSIYRNRIRKLLHDAQRLERPMIYKDGINIAARCLRMLFYKPAWPQQEWIGIRANPDYESLRQLHEYFFSKIKIKLNIMEHEKIIVGLDVGTTKICAVAGRINEFGKLDILGIGVAKSEGVAKGVVENINKTVEAIEKAILGINNFEIEVAKVNIGISGHHISSSVHRNSITRESNDTEIMLHDVERLTQDMYRILMPPGSKIIHVMPKFYSVDYTHGVKDPIGMSGVKLEADFHIISANQNAINNINKCARHVKLECEKLILESLASSLSVLSAEEREAGVCLVDIGGGTTDVAIFHDNIIRHTVVLPFGGDIITADIRKGLMIMAWQAEALKTVYGTAVPEEANSSHVVSIPGIRQREPKEISVKNLALIIEARMGEIMELVHAEIIASGFEKRLAGGIVLTGGGAQLAGLRKLAEFETGMDARIGFPNEHLGKTVAEEIKNPMFATAVGLVLAGFRSLDEREPRCRGKDSSQEKTKQDKKPPAGEGFFSGLLAKAKALLINDLNDKGEY